MNDNSEETKSEELETSLSRSKALLKESLSWLIVFASAILVALFISRFIIFKAEVPTGSMKNTINEGDKLLAFRIYGEIQRGDIIIFYPPDSMEDRLKYEESSKNGEEPELYVKRVIGLPGETIEVKNNTVYIDGVALDEPYIAEEMNRGDFGPYKIPAECYFVLGDNRNHSADSRYWTTRKHVAKEEIVAKVVFKMSPEFEVLKRPEY